MASWIRIGLAGALATSALAMTASEPATASVSERRLLTEINDLRSESGVDRLRRSRSLARSAGRYGEHILRVNDLHHHDRVWASSRFRVAGENLAWQSGRRSSARSVARLWADSPAHRRVLLDPRLEYGGVGREYGKLGSRRATVWVLHVGAR